MVEEWSNDGLSALKLRLVRSDEDAKLLSEDDKTKISDFSPTFVYPIFGEEETIFGYQGLQIQLRFASGSLAQYLNVTYDEKFPSTGEVEADDPEKTLYNFIPPDYAKQLPEFSKTVERDSLTFKPVGTKVGSYRIKSEKGTSASNGKGKGKGKVAVTDGPSLPERSWEIIGEGEDPEEDVVYEVYGATWDTPGFKEYHRRMQVFVLLYIEGATYIDEDDPRWEFLILFERRKRGSSVTHHFAGYTSFYSFFCWPDTKRLRLSQFVILPPYQGQGHGSALYSVAYQNILRRPEISELTVEDPAEAFEDMRDKADLHMLITEGALSGLTAPISRDVSETIRKKYKLADRQFYRLVEMYLLLTLDSSDRARLTAYRLAVKRRLYAWNREMLMQIDTDERKVKLQETFLAVEEDYRRLIEGFA
ncbi:histone acetyltransferase type B catalytic subunit [Meredithblackwellia eburnea MCA 4105]